MAARLLKLFNIIIKFFKIFPKLWLADRELPANHLLAIPNRSRVIF